MEQNKEASITNKYNLFSPNKLIEPLKPTSASKKSKMEIKLVFHHPNLLFLNSKKVRSREDTSKEVGENLMRSLKSRSKHITKSTANFRPCTSYQSEKERTNLIRNSASNTPAVRRSHTEEGLEVCGKSSCLTNELIRNPTPNFHHFKTTTTNNFFPHRPKNNENIFRKMQGKAGKEKTEAWSELMLDKAKRHAVRLDMYFSVQKKYIKYVSRCR